MMPAHHQHNHQARSPSNQPGDHQANTTAAMVVPPAGTVNNPVPPGALIGGVRPSPPSEELCVEFDYTWPLNIAVLQAEGPKEPIACPEFSTSYKSISYKWQLLLYLSRPLSQFGLYLCYKAGPVDFISIDCEMFVSALDHSRAYSNLARKVELEVEGRAWGYANFCPQDLSFLERSTKAMLIGPEENELNIGVTIRISTQYFSIRNFFRHFHQNKEAERLSAYLFEKVCLDFDFGAERADCRIIASDGAGFYANRAVLEYASPVFQQLLTKTNPFVSNEQSYNEITVDDLTSPALREILHYVYKGVPSEHLAAIATEVVHGAHKFQLPNLKSLCEKAMVYQLCEKNAIKFLYTAETYQLPILRNMSLNMVVDRWPVLHASKDADKLLSDKVIVKKIMGDCSARANCHLNLVRLDTGLRMQHQQAPLSQSLPQQPQSTLPAQQQQQQPGHLPGLGGKTLPPLPTAFDDMYLYSLRGSAGGAAAAGELLQTAYYPQTASLPAHNHQQQQHQHQQQHMLIRRHGSEPQLQQLTVAAGECGPGDIDGIGGIGGYPIGRTPLIIPTGTLQAGTATGNEPYQTPLLNGGTELASRQQQQQLLQQLQLRQQQQQGQQHFHNSATVTNGGTGAGSSATSSTRRSIHPQQQQHVTFSDHMKPGQRTLRSDLPSECDQVYQSIPRGSNAATTFSATGRSAPTGATPPRDVIDIPGRLIGGHQQQQQQQNLYSAATSPPPMMSAAGSAFKSVSATNKRRRRGNAAATNQYSQYSRISSSQPGGGTLNMSSSG